MTQHNCTISIVKIDHTPDLFIGLNNMKAMEILYNLNMYGLQYQDKGFHMNL